MNIELLDSLSVSDIQSIRKLTDDELYNYYKDHRFDELELEYNYNNRVVTRHNWKKIIENIISGKILVNEFNSKNIDILISYLDRDDDKFVDWVKSLIGKQFKNKKITLKYYLSDIYVGHDLSSNNLRGYDECRIYNNNNMKNREINTLIEIIIYYLIFMYEVDNKDWNEYISGIIGGRIYEQYQYIKNGNFTKYINKINQIIEDLNIDITILIEQHIKHHIAGDNTKFILDEISKIKCKLIIE